MKKIFSFIFSLIAVLVTFVSCSSDSSSYENLLKAEKSSISSYISRNNINVISSAPTNNVWGDKDYLLTSTGLYIHIVDTGEVSSATVISGQLIISRYNKITLDAVPDTIIKDWTSADYPYPLEFNYKVSSLTTVPTAFHEAVKYMKHNNAVAKLIVPSKLGTTTDVNNVIPYFYDLKIKLGD
ncbi:MAG: DUF4827 family protein [Paludibacteraceae bacterium]|nr:DUF4827 family protein [Paludibacteraceae bacterium]